MGHNHNNNIDDANAAVSEHNEHSQSTQDVTMRDSGASNVNLNSQPSAMNIDSQNNDDDHNNEDSIQHEEDVSSRPQTRPRRRSTIILTDDPEFEKLKSKREDYNLTPDLTNEESISKLEDHNNSQDSQHNNNTVPFEIEWVQGGENVFITGSFTGWRKMIKLTKDDPNSNRFSITLKLPIGTHRFRFVVDNELQFSDHLPTATDHMGNFVNYIEIQQPDIQMSHDGSTNDDLLNNNNNNKQQQQTEKEQEQEVQDQHQQYNQKPKHSFDQLSSNEKERKDSNLGLTNDDDDMGNGYSRFHEEASLKPKLNYVSDIPAVFTDPSVMEQYYLTLDNNAQNNQNQAWLTPPQLPPHLESVILNQFSTQDKSNSSGALPIPNHVVLNHLATTSIKHNTLAVASVVRYKRKYATQVLYAPLQ
ncbi:hypothetical protein BN7_3768 [Wickerhamomyces ciferrii]|uniref:Association with the SNF1 complex (ASC) domain-containing protein n=1 Tax=Wickerhamomyces ciferrii (strain ATCC 14091 / BCRC 22168 / CBS 111 / JCM 3599 / NBRC 0793 / NRRL Y-1031 F-60-10) TaxID=1206466 RepID=K0KSA1_WICCF|nr:uncharacterized protein BN7_3768 [Wickerhamomyces ciferrii]CCH44209.1 hypothetical protein BN7_3768 [Wickerhamomyces ciferrii]